MSSGSEFGSALKVVPTRYGRRWIREEGAMRLCRYCCIEGLTHPSDTSRRAIYTFHYSARAWASWENKWMYNSWLSLVHSSQMRMKDKLFSLLLSLFCFVLVIIKKKHSMQNERFRVLSAESWKLFRRTTSPMLTNIVPPQFSCLSWNNHLIRRNSTKTPFDFHISKGICPMRITPDSSPTHLPIVSRDTVACYYILFSYTDDIDKELIKMLKVWRNWFNVIYAIRQDIRYKFHRSVWLKFPNCPCFTPTTALKQSIFTDCWHY